MNPTPNEPLLFNLKTPGGMILKDLAITLAVLPGYEGDLGIMANHAELMTPLQSGKVRLFDGDKQIQSFDAHEKQHVMVHVHDNTIDCLMDDFCVQCYPLNMTGLTLNSPLKCDCKTCGTYRVEKI